MDAWRLYDELIEGIPQDVLVLDYCLWKQKAPSGSPTPAAEAPANAPMIATSKACRFGRWRSSRNHGTSRRRASALRR